MANRPTSWPLLRALLSHGRLSLRLLREPAVPAVVKTLPLVAALYIILPVDFIPDFLPILGQFDDLGIALLALEAFLKVCPQAAVEFHRTAMAQRRKYRPMTPEGRVIDAEFRRHT